MESSSNRQPVRKSRTISCKPGRRYHKGNLPKDVLKANPKLRDDECYACKEFDLASMSYIFSRLPIGEESFFISEGYRLAGSKVKYLTFITGRHNLPFYHHDEVEGQKGFLNAFLKREDAIGWPIPGKIASVSIIFRKGDVGFNNPEFEATYKRREEMSWLISRTVYTKYHLQLDGSLLSSSSKASSKMSCRVLGSLENLCLLRFMTAAFEQHTKITGHIVAHLRGSFTPHFLSPYSDIDLFLTLR